MILDLSSFIRNCTSLTTLDVSSWNTSSVTNFNAFAYGCTSLTTLDVSSWATSSVTNFGNFAYNCHDLVVLNTTSWDTSSVTNCSYMCINCTSLISSFTDTLWWNRAIPISTYIDCFKGAVNISNYSEIPNSWKGL